VAEQIEHRISQGKCHKAFTPFVSRQNDRTHVGLRSRRFFMDGANPAGDTLSPIAAEPYGHSLYKNNHSLVRPTVDSVTATVHRIPDSISTDDVTIASDVEPTRTIELVFNRRYADRGGPK